MSDRARLRLFSIPPGVPFLETLLEAVMDGRLVPGLDESPLELARTTILLPTRRACRSLAELFATRLGRPTLLPRIRPIGEVEEADEALREAAEDGLDAPDLPPAIPPLERRIALTRLVLAWAKRLRDLGRPVPVPASPADAAWLAGELARLLDTVATESLTIDALDRIAPENLQEHWQVSLEFLEIARMNWPAYLSAAGYIEPAERRRLLVEAEAARLARSPPAPVIAAGSTGSIPATAKLLTAIARLPRGAVVLPGLDRDMDDATFAALAGGPEGPGDPVPSHPQASMARFLRGLGVTRRAEDVTVLTESDALRARERLLSALMRPADSTEVWSRAPLPLQDVTAALDGIGIGEAANEQEEAKVIAALLRESLDMPGRTAALVTPDRMLARRVAAELARYGLVADDTSGLPLADCPPALLARLVAEAVRDDFTARTLLPLLRHPLTRLGATPHDLAHATGRLERIVFRGLAPAPGLAGLRAALDAAADTRDRDRSVARQGLSDADFAVARHLLGRLEEAVAPLASLQARDAVPLTDIAAAHARVIDALSAGEEREDGPRGVAELDQLFAEIAAVPAGGFACASDDYPELFLALLSGRTVRPPVALDPRLKIYGLLEARLVRHDRLVLGGLAEGVWPAATTTDPWLSRSMRAEVGLPAPERRIGLSAHDFAQALGTRDVWITRALRAGTAPTVPSRWLQRLAAVVGEDSAKSADDSPLHAARLRGALLIEALRARDTPAGRATPMSRPAPAPPLEARPRRLSVTRIERLIRNPYAVYVSEVLQLRALEELGADPGAAERGTMIHEIFAASAKLADSDLTLENVLELGRAVFGAVAPFPDLHAVWWQRFLPAAEWFVGFERARRADGRKIAIEVDGRMTFDLPAGPFVLTARADRIEQTDDGRFVVVDFKTGDPPTAANMKAGKAPQLPLEALIVQRGGFPGFAAQLLPTALEVMKVTGKAGGVAETSFAGTKEVSLEALIAETEARTRALLTRFDQPRTPYRARIGTAKDMRHDDTRHLARVQEWGLMGDGEEGGA